MPLSCVPWSLPLLTWLSFVGCQLRAAIRGEAGSSGSGEGDREALVLAELEKARTQLRNVAEDLAAAQRHVEQYKTIAAANEAMLQQATEEHARFREAAQQAQAAMEAEAEGLRGQMARLEGELAAVKEAAEQREKAVAAEGEAGQRERQTQQEELGRTQGALQEAEARVGALKEEVERTRQEYTRAQAHYQQQVRTGRVSECGMSQHHIRQSCKARCLLLLLLLLIEGHPSSPRVRFCRPQRLRCFWFCGRCWPKRRPFGHRMRRKPSCTLQRTMPRLPKVVQRQRSNSRWGDTREIWLSGTASLSVVPMAFFSTSVTAVFSQEEGFARHMASHVTFFVLGFAQASSEVAWAAEKSALASQQEAAERKAAQLEQQNRILLDRLEIHRDVVPSPQPTGTEEAGEQGGDIQNVLRYLRREKETVSPPPQDTTPALVDPLSSSCEPGGVAMTAGLDALS